ncbi:MAG: hypothetical protein ACRDPY_09930 [Streptosporangiaceae bacterium]
MTTGGAASFRCPSCDGLHAVDGGRTPLQEIAMPLLALTGQERFYNILDRAGFGYVEEVTATPDTCLLELRNIGPKLIATVRYVIASLDSGGTGAQADADGRDLAAGAMQPTPVPEVTSSLRTVAAWAQAERGARTLGEVLALADGIVGLPPDVARAWELIAGTSLRSLAGPPDEKDLPGLAEELLGRVEQRRRLILTDRTLAPRRRTYASLAAELGITSTRVRELEQSACQQLTLAAAGSRYAPLRRRALTAVTSTTRTPDPPPGSPPWMDGLLAWLAQRMQEAEYRSPSPSRSPSIG